jgi:hypothetical protein
MTVSDNLFLEESLVPDAASIKAALGDRYPWYEGVLEAAKGFERDWKHYGKKYGWKLKAHDGTKALFELTLAAAGIRISIAARESELQALREGAKSASILAKLLPPGQSKEGWGIRLSVADAESYGQAVALIEALAEIRLKG